MIKSARFAKDARCFTVRKVLRVRSFFIGVLKTGCVCSISFEHPILSTQARFIESKIGQVPGKIEHLVKTRCSICHFQHLEVLNF